MIQFLFPRYSHPLFWFPLLFCRCWLCVVALCYALVSIVGCGFFLFFYCVIRASNAGLFLKIRNGYAGTTIGRAREAHGALCVVGARASRRRRASVLVGCCCCLLTRKKKNFLFLVCWRALRGAHTLSTFGVSLGRRRSRRSCSRACARSANSASCGLVATPPKKRRFFFADCAPRRACSTRQAALDVRR